MVKIKPTRLATARTRGELKVDGRRTFWLKDYLGPDGRFPYDDLPGDLDACFAAGESVDVLDVPRLTFMIDGAQMMRGYARPWAANGRPGKPAYYATAWDAVLDRNGYSTPGRKR